MEETDVGRLFAAVAPETVPTVGGLPERARALGHRQRRRRAVMSGGGTALALAGVVGAVVTLGGFGSGQPAKAGSGPAIGPGSTGTGPVPSSDGGRSLPGMIPVSPPTGSKVFSPPGSGKDPSFPTASHDPVADAAVLAAIKAALPAEYAAELKLFRGAEMNGYAAEFNMGQAVLDVSVTHYVPGNSGGTPTTCTADASHCTEGTATLQGHQVRWTYYSGGMSGGPGLTVDDDQASVSYFFSEEIAAPLGMAEMKGVGLNNQVAGALLATLPKK